MNDLLHFPSHRNPNWRSFDVRSLVCDLCESLAPQLSAQRIKPDVDIPLGLTLRADREMLSRAILNLVTNALDAMPAGGELVITAWSGPRGLELEVADSGPGIEEDVRNRVFEPFFTTKSGGTGLGLAIVYRVAEAHGGAVTVCNCPEGGAAFTITIPHRAMEAAA